MKKSEIIKKVENDIRFTIAVAEYHKSLISKLKWSPRKDGKPKAEFKDNLTDDPAIRAYIFAYCDGDGNFRVGFNSISRCMTYESTKSDIFKKFDKYLIPSDVYLYKNFCRPSPVNGAPVPMIKDAKERFNFIVTEFPKIIDEKIARCKDELKLVKGKFSKSLGTYIKATAAFRKEFFDCSKHREIATALADYSDYEWTRLRED